VLIVAGVYLWVNTHSLQYFFPHSAQTPKGRFPLPQEQTSTLKKCRPYRAVIPTGMWVLSRFVSEPKEDSGVILLSLLFQIVFQTIWNYLEGCAVEALSTIDLGAHSQRHVLESAVGFAADLHVAL
jgi:hypothetical protein